MSKKNTTTDDLPEDLEIVGPGKLLAAAREKSGLTMQQVADKLNFRLVLVEKIEKDQFDRTLPATFNRGYLKNYAKLVHIPEQEILDSYDRICVAQQQDTGLQSVVMQSFSKETEKQAENNRLMWVSYLILAVLVGSTLMWWLQVDNTNATKKNQNATEEVVASTANKDIQADSVNTGNVTIVDTNTAGIVDENESELIDEGSTFSEEGITEGDFQIADTAGNNAETAIVDTFNPITENLAGPVDVSFTFLGDCWVNIYDATGERIAWGIKKAEYEMSISGQPPFSITLGKPELVSIVYDGVAVDMSNFSRGNIAKFTLPLE
jgi:cytoskeleton protein RodZ